MTQKYWSPKPTSFAETIELIEQYVEDEVVREAKSKQLYYHNLDHALAVKRRAERIFRAIRPVLSQNHSSLELTRLEGLISVCGLAHDMVQVFEPTPPDRPRKRKSGLSEKASADKILDYIQQFNQFLNQEKINPSILIGDREQQIIQDAIIATICIPDSQDSRTEPIFSSRSLYQPYLYDARSKVSIVGSIIALADLGALGMEGAEAHVRDGISVFLEDNPHLHELVANCDLSGCSQLEMETIGEKLLGMTRFIVELAHERRALFEIEIAGFETQIRHILRSQVFINLNQESISRVENLVPHQSDTRLDELVSFFCSKQDTLTQ